MKKFWKWKNQAERTLFLNGTIAEESWFDDDVTPQLFKEELMGGSGDITVWMLYSKAAVVNSLMDKIAAKCRTKPKKIEDSKPKGRSVDSLYERLNLLKN